MWEKISANYANLASVICVIVDSGFSAITLLMDRSMFTRCLIATIDEEAIKKFGDHSKFSRAAWPGYKNQAGTWRAIRNPRSNGKSRALYLEDLLCISSALGIPLSELFFRVEQRLKMGWQPSAEDSLLIENVIPQEKKERHAPHREEKTA